MQDRPFIFNSNDDPTLVVLDKKNQAKAKKAYQELRMAAQELYTRYETGTLEAGFRTTLTSLLESYTVELNKAFGYNGKLAEDQERRTAQIRSLNIENHALREQLGEKVSYEDVREKLKNIEKLVRAWWKSTGFSYVSKLSFTDSGILKLRLSTTQFASSFFADDNDEQLKGEDVLAQQGMQFVHAGPREKNVIDNEHNRALLTELIKKRFPSARILSFENHYNNATKPEEQGFTMWSVEVYVYNLDDLNGQ